MSAPGLVRLLVASYIMSHSLLAVGQTTLRPPSIPLVAHDPYFSIWSPADHLTDKDTAHWTGASHPLRSSITVDGVEYALMGVPAEGQSKLRQVALRVTPTCTEYVLAGAGVKVTLSFRAAALPHNLDLYSRPVTYIDWQVESDQNESHTVSIRFSVGGQIAAGGGEQLVTTKSESWGDQRVLSVGTDDQRVLGRTGDGVTIDWGHLILAAPEGSLKGSWAAERSKPAKDVSLRLEWKEKPVGPMQARFSAMLAYDDEYSIQYFHQNLKPYWRRGGDDAKRLIAKAGKERDSIEKQCQAFDAELMADLRKAGGDAYAQLCALAYRQAVAGCKLVADPKGQPLLFPKENTSNGCIATADVIYPMSPQFLLLGHSLSKAMVVPIMDYASSGRWKFPFAPHDLGTYPKANRQVYGGGERTEENQMPVEESANMLILMAAICHRDGSAEFASQYWPVLTKWANYLRDKGFDPENQLCTDDFLGHLAHNVNLSAKAMIGIACYARMAELKGDRETAHEYEALTKQFSARWMKEAVSGDHTRLAFDKPDTWSQKYNLVWDKILGLGLFPDEVRRSEMAHYRSKNNPFGLPLDSRGTGTKLDWTLWTATLTQNREDFEAILNPVLRYVSESPQRVGMGDWYNTATGHFNFMHSRPVVGGVFLQMLYSEAGWKKWYEKDKTKIGLYAPIPKPPVVTKIIPAADTEPGEWKYLLAAPGKGWMNLEFADKDWSTGLAGFGTYDTPGVSVHTVWNGKDIWLRREFEFSKDQLKDLHFWIHHDDEVEVYVNGVLAFQSGGWTSQYEERAIAPEALKALKPGKNLVAIHCHQNAGGQYIDLGFVRVSPGK